MIWICSLLALTLVPRREGPFGWSSISNVHGPYLYLNQPRAMFEPCQGQSKSDKKIVNPPIGQHKDISNGQIGTLLALVMARSTKKMIENRFFAIGGEIYHQKHWCLIELDLSVVWASLHMTSLDRKFLDKLRKLGIAVVMYKVTGQHNHGAESHPLWVNAVHCT